MAIDDGLSVVHNVHLVITVFVLQETQERFPKLGQMEPWDELGSGDAEEGSTDCDDEDGCQASGDGQSQNCESHTNCTHIVYTVYPAVVGLTGQTFIFAHNRVQTFWSQSHLFFVFFFFLSPSRFSHF